jgi:4-diphosphocytidyl-2-C-methyl-D-erythritol kinase
VGDLGSLARSLSNDLAPVTKGLVPEVKALIEELQCAGALGASMSGSGTAVFGIFCTEVEARGAANGLLAPFVRVCEPVVCGVELL